MPFVAQDPDSGEAIRAKYVTEDFNIEEILECPYCEAPLKYRRRATGSDGNTLRRGHFWHFENAGGGAGGGGCAAGGESAEHEKWKLAIAELVEEKYDSSAIYVEKEIGPRRADVALETDKAVCDFVIEYQHKNATKDYAGATADYIHNGYGVFWVFNTDNDYKAMFRAKEALEPILESQPYLGEKRNDEIELGRPIWADDLDV